MTPEKKTRLWIAGIATAVVLVVCAAITLFVVTGDHSRITGQPSQCSCPYMFCPTTDLDTCNGGDRGPGGAIVVAVGKSPKGWNPGSVRGNAGDTAQEVTPLLPSAYILMPSGKVQWNKDLLAAEPRVTATGQVQIVYQIRPEAIWNDGTGRARPITAQDFVFTWRIRDGHDKRLSVLSTAGYDQIDSVVGSRDGRTVTVTFREPYGDWRGLFTLLEPYWFAAATTGRDATDAASMTDTQLEKAFAALDSVPTFSAGPFMISQITPGGDTTEVPNPLWYGATKPTLTTITFRQVDSRQTVALLQNRDIGVFTAATPGLDTVQQLGNILGINYEVAPGYSWDQLQFNTADPFLRDAKLREAIMDVIDVQALINKSVKPFFPDARRLYSHNLFPGQAGYQDIVKFVDPVAGTGNLDAAKQVLAVAGYTGIGVPNGLKAPDGRHVTVTLVHTRTVVRNTSARPTRDEIAQLGATVHDQTIDDSSNTLTTRRFGIAEFAVTDGPLAGTTADLWSTHGAVNLTGWGDARSDGLLAAAARTMDPAQRSALLNQQDQILTATHVDLPLYQLPQLFAVDSRYVGIRLNPAGGYITYNTQEWGLFKPTR